MFGYAPAYGVIVKAGGLCTFVLGAWSSGGCYLDEVVFFVPAEGLRSVFARQLADEAAMAVVEVTFVFVHPHQIVAHIAALRQGGGLLYLQLCGTVLDVACRVVAKAFVGCLGKRVLDAS